MLKKIKVLLIAIILILLVSLIFIKLQNKKDIESTNFNSQQISDFDNSNTIKAVQHSSKDKNNNQYTITSDEAVVDLANPDILFLTNVKAIIKRVNSDEIIITSNFGKYNISNYETIFSRNVIIKYSENKITGEYLDFSPNRNFIIASRDIVFTNKENILIADVIEVDIDTKNTKIFMYDNNKKVNINNTN